MLVKPLYYALVIAVLTAFCAAPSGADLVGYWKFDETSGTTAFDSATADGSQDGTLNNFPANDLQWVSGLLGGGLAVRDTNDQMVLNPVLDISYTDNLDWTIATWFEGLSNSAGYRTLTRGTADHQVLVNPSGELGTYANPGVGFRSSGYNVSSLGAGWHHLAAVGSGSQTAFFVDGAPVGTPASFKSTSDIRDVGNHGGQRFADTLDDMGVWNATRTQAQIAATYGLGKLAGVTLDDTKIEELATMTESGQSGDKVENVGPGAQTWYYADSGATPQLSGATSRAYETGDHKYIVTGGDAGSGWTGATTNRFNGTLAAHWSYDDSGDVGKDDTGHGYDGTLQSSFYNDDPERGGTLRLDGQGSKMMLLGPATPNPVEIDADWTIASWFKGLLPDGRYRTLVKGYNTVEGRPEDHHVLINPDGWLGAYDNSASSFKNSGFEVDDLDSGWHHIVAVGSDSKTAFYIDGAHVGTANFKTDYEVYSIGNNYSGAQLFADYVDDGGVWRAALSSKEVAAVYGLGKLSGLKLNDPGIVQVAALDAPGQSVAGVGPSGDTWYYSMYVDPSQGRAYNDGGSKYIVLEETLGGSWGATTNSVVTGLAGHWSYNDSSDPGHDDTGHGYEGELYVYSGSVAWADDPERGGVLELAGNSMMRIEKDGTPGVDIGDSWSAAAWFKGLLPGNTWRTLFRGEGGDHQLLLGTDGHVGSYGGAPGIPYGFQDSGFDIDGPNNDEFDADAWHHLVAVGSGLGEESKTEFYLDGVWVGEIEFKSQTDIGAIGNNYFGAQLFADYIDDGGVWQTALTPREIAAIHGLGLFSGVDLDDGSIGAALLLGPTNPTLGGVGPENDFWYFTDRFATIGGSLPDMQVGLAYLGDDGFEYIVLDGSPGDWVGITTRFPEPGTLMLALMAAALVVPMRRRA